MKSSLLLLFCGGLLLGCSPASEPSAPDVSPINLDAAVAAAKTEKKLVLLDFTGSDWCPPCKMLKKEVFSASEFKTFAQANLVVLEIDFPRGREQSEAVKKTNEILGAKFEIEGLPTLILLDGEGKPVWRNTGYPAGGLKEVLSELEAARKKLVVSLAFPAPSVFSMVK